MARDFSGTNGNYLSAADSASLSITGTAVTLAAWVNPDDFGNEGFIVGINDDSVIQYQMSVRQTNGHAFGSIGAGGTFQNVESAASLTAGAWQHIAVRKNGTGAGALRSFINGTNDGSSTSDTSITDQSLACAIGDSPGSAFWNAFDGRIAEVAIWAAALDDAEIVSLARGFSPLLVRPASLRAYWPLLGNSSPEPDLRNGNNASVTGTVAKAADHPRVIVPRPAIYVP